MMADLVMPFTGICCFYCFPFAEEGGERSRYIKMSLLAYYSGYICSPSARDLYVPCSCDVLLSHSEGLSVALAAVKKTAANPGNPLACLCCTYLSVVNVCLIGWEFNKSEFL